MPAAACAYVHLLARCSPPKCFVAKVEEIKRLVQNAIVGAGVRICWLHLVLPDAISVESNLLAHLVIDINQVLRQTAGGRVGQALNA